MRPLAITCGDPAGVGPELISELAREGVLEHALVFGPARWLDEIGVAGMGVGDPDFQALPGKPSPQGAGVALAAMEAAAQACRSGHCRAVVTGPISKQSMAEVGFPFPGQTEFFADRWGGDPVMGFVGQHMQVVLATWHCPLRAVPDLLEQDPALLERAVIQADRLARLRDPANPRIALCGLNPHAGENGLLGSEEERFIAPQAQQLRARFPALHGPLPADTVFWRLRQQEFAAAVALYHDQGLAPLKTLEFNTAVNVTLGLRWIRTSPDHGTAFDRAGTGTADPGSLRQAIHLAHQLSSLI